MVIITNDDGDDANDDEINQHDDDGNNEGTDYVDIVDKSDNSGDDNG